MMTINDFEIAVVELDDLLGLGKVQAALRFPNQWRIDPELFEEDEDDLRLNAQLVLGAKATKSLMAYEGPSNPNPALAPALALVAADPEGRRIVWVQPGRRSSTRRVY